MTIVRNEFHSFFVPGKPKGKQRPRASRSGIFYTPKASKDYEALIRGYCDYTGVLVEGPIRMCMVAWTKNDKRISDLDNIAKSIMDALNGVVYQDDRQVWELFIRRVVIDKNNPEHFEGVAVTLSILEEDHD